MVLNVLFLTLMTTVLADESAVAASGAVEVLLTLLNSSVTPALVPKVSVAGVTCVPVVVTPRTVPSATVMFPVPVFEP